MTELLLIWTFGDRQSVKQSLFKKIRYKFYLRTDQGYLGIIYLLSKLT